MTETKTTGAKITGDRRAQHVALLGGVLQAAACALLLATGLWSDSRLVLVLTRFLMIGVPIWCVLYLVFNQIRRVELEALETAELKRHREGAASQALFELDDEALLIEQNRLSWMVRWLLPGTTVFVALLLLLGHFVAWGWSLSDAFDPAVLTPTLKPTLIMWVVIAAGFLCFLYGRYALALSALPRWRLIRAGAACMAGNAIACVIVALALMAGGTMTWAEPAAAYAIRLSLIILGVEFALNFILDLYRPRTPGEITRPSFDSRLLGMSADPGSIAKSIADAVNYQFGFQVSSTWFYQLLQRWLFPITVAVCAIVLGLTSIVIVEADEQAIVERYGVIDPQRSVLSPGIHLKWPFPRDVVYRAGVRRISEIVIGEEEDHGDEDGHGDEGHDDAVIWTEGHGFLPHLMLLVASPELEGVDGRPNGDTEAPSLAKGAESVPVSMLMVSVPIEYRIKDLHKYLYKYSEPEKLLEAVAYQYVTDFAARVDVDELMGPGREAFNTGFARALQRKLDELDVGIEVVFAGLRGAHPPDKEKVAVAYQSVVAAETSRAAMVHAAQGRARTILIRLAGTESRARALDDAILARDGLSREHPEFAAAAQRVEDLLLGNPAKGVAPVSGESAAMLSRARAEASEAISRAGAKALTFGTQVAAYRAAPSLYTQRKALEKFAGIENTRKYLIVGDRSNVIIEYETSRQAGLDQVLSEGLETERKARE